jgi:hypothetical protein
MWALLDVKLVQSSAIRYERISSRAIEELVDLPLMSDPAYLETLNVLIKLGAVLPCTDMFGLAVIWYGIRSARR